MQKQPSSYHKEDLKGDLIKAATAYVTEFGHDDLSVRKLAKIVGVSPGAPYHHFPDRRSLLLAVALEGYRNLITLARIDESASARDQLICLAVDILNFANHNQRLFDLMYQSELTRPELDPEIAAAQLRGFEKLQSAVTALNPNLDRSEISIRIANLWSAIYGFALLRQSHMIQPGWELIDPYSERTTLNFVEHAVRVIE